MRDRQRERKREQERKNDYSKHHEGPSKLQRTLGRKVLQNKDSKEGLSK